MNGNCPGTATVLQWLHFSAGRNMMINNQWPGFKQLRRPCLEFTISLSLQYTSCSMHSISSRKKKNCNVTAYEYSACMVSHYHSSLARGSSNLWVQYVHLVSVLLQCKEGKKQLSVRNSYSRASVWPRRSSPSIALLHTIAHTEKYTHIHTHTYPQLWA